MRAKIIDVLKNIRDVKNQLKLFFSSVFPLYKERARIQNWLSVWLQISYINIFIFSKNNPRKNRKILVRLTDGGTLYIPWDKRGDIPSIVFLSNDYLDRLKSYLDIDLDWKDDDVVIDAGAHVGLFATPIARDFPNVKVFCFEPDPQNFKLLELNLLNARQSRLKVQAIPKAIYDSDDGIAFSVGRSSTIGNVAETGFFKNNGKEKQIHVETIRLRQFMQQEKIKHIKLLKLDVEGAEYKILESDPDLLDCVELFVLEAHPSRAGDPEKLLALLREKGFKFKHDVLSNGCFEVFAKANN